METLHVSHSVLLRLELHLVVRRLLAHGLRLFSISNTVRAIDEILAEAGGQQSGENSVDILVMISHKSAN
jgi:hypothetical protein